MGAWDEWREEIEEIRDLGSRVLVCSTQYGRSKGTGIEVETRYAVLYEVHGGKIIRMALHSTRAEALEAAGLRRVGVSQANAEIVRRSFVAFNARDVDALVSLSTPDCELLPFRAQLEGIVY